ncbi:MAG: hypothetical protein GC153_09755 [Alphaproteobacteria bacterium]|nr:hypothetical protein [Alphaproteobacteria bacterium]
MALRAVGRASARHLYTEEIACANDLLATLTDSNGNMTADSLGESFAYDADDRLTSVSGNASATLSYDPAGRLHEVAGTATMKFLYYGGQAIAEYDGSGNLLRRYVPAPLPL